MLNLLSQTDRASLQEALTTHLHGVAAKAPRGDRSLVARAEGEVRADPSAHLRFDCSGLAKLDAADRTFLAGRFETPRLGELRRRAEEALDSKHHPKASRSFWVLDGASPATDIGALQATAPTGSLFQVASQFNCLESPGAFVVNVADYFHDPTQGPRASISAFPGTLLRHYAAPTPQGERFVQSTAGRQLNLLADVCEPGIASVESGYLKSSSIRAPDEFARSLEDRFDDLRVGLHDEVEVVYGYDWDGQVPEAPLHRIAQVFTSSVAAGGYSRLDHRASSTGTIVRQLQRAAHFGTLLAAASLGKAHVGLTLIGGGVFGNPIPLIWESILWAVDAIVPLLHRDLVVVVNGRNLGQHVPAALLRDAAAARGGALAVFDRDSVSIDAG